MKSEVIFENSHYCVCAMRDGALVVTCKRRKPGTPGYGARLVGENASIWADHIREAVAVGDTGEASVLCRAIVPAASDRTKR